jgi:hypothetical protein
MFTSFLEVREATKVNYIAGLSSEFVDSICDILTQQHLDPADILTQQLSTP